MSKTKIKTACVLMIGPDSAMDEVGDDSKPANPLPVKCPHCTFPDIEFVAKPYLLAKGFASPAETWSAVSGNFLVRERVRRILEVAVPGACVFHPTADRKTKKPAPWWLAVPNQKLKTFFPPPKPPFCSKCHAPKIWDAHFGKVWQAMKRFDSGGHDVFKMAEWSAGTVEDAVESTNRYREKEAKLPPLPWSHWGITPPPHPERWTRTEFDRDLYFSVRLEQLLKRAKVKGRLVRYLDFHHIKPSPQDEAWIEAKFKLLAGHGLVDVPKPTGGKSSLAAQKWFAQFLKQNAKKGMKPVDFAAMEKKRKLPLPQSYKDFISTVGPKSFKNVGDVEETLTSILLPQKLDFKDYRRGKVPYLEGEDAEVDGVMFADTDYGDCFVFDVSAKDADYPVHWYRHEENVMEPFAPNFTECIKRFVQQN